MRKHNGLSPATCSVSLIGGMNEGVTQGSRYKVVPEFVGWREKLGVGICWA